MRGGMRRSGGRGYRVLRLEDELVRRNLLEAVRLVRDALGSSP
jgi:hypothetical protein